MSYATAFIMVGRVFLWALLIITVPTVFFLAGAESNREIKFPEISDCTAELLTFGVVFYAAVILCARYVQ